VQGRRARLFARHKPSTYPNRRRAVGKRGGEATSVGDASRSDDDDGFSGQRTFGILAKIDNCRNKDGERRVTGVPATFTTLCANDVDTYRGALCSVRG
jgi:hypothetical protein